MNPSRLAHLARREALAVHLLAPDLGRLPERREQRVAAQILETDGNALVGDQLGDSAAHDPGPQHRRAADLPRKGDDASGVFLERRLALEEPHQVLRRPSGHELADDARFEIEPLGHRHGERRVDRLERAERSGIVLGARLGLRGLRALPMTKRRSGGVISTRRAVQDRRRVKPRGGLQHELDGLALEVGLGNHEIDQSQALRPLRRRGCGRRGSGRATARDRPGAAAAACRRSRE